MEYELLENKGNVLVIVIIIVVPSEREKKVKNLKLIDLRRKQQSKESKERKKIRGLDVFLSLLFFLFSNLAMLFPFYFQTAVMFSLMMMMILG